MRGRGRTVAGAGVTGAVTVLVLAGCTLPDGVDGDLTSAWGEVPAAVPFVPEPGTCHPGDYSETGSMQAYDPIPCDRPHVTETVYVGEFTGDAGDRVSPPEPGSSVWRGAFQQCEEGAADYLGADFRYGELWLGVTVPTEAAWSGGARWVRCDVVEEGAPERVGSLAGVFAGATELALRCFRAEVSDGGGVTALDPVACSDPHDTEFAGVVFSGNSSYPTGDGALDRMHGDCREQVADYVDVPVDGDLQFRTGTIVSPPEEADWDYGDRGFRCYLWLDREVTESLAGAGTDGLPVQ